MCVCVCPYVFMYVCICYLYINISTWLCFFVCIYLVYAITYKPDVSGKSGYFDVHGGLNLERSELNLEKSDLWLTPYHWAICLGLHIYMFMQRVYIYIRWSLVHITEWCFEVKHWVAVRTILGCFFGHICLKRTSVNVLVGSGYLGEAHLLLIVSFPYWAT